MFVMVVCFDMMIFVLKLDMNIDKFFFVGRIMFMEK